MDLFKKTISKEISYFRALSADGQRLIKAIFFYNIIDPVLYLFTNAFLWRNSHDIFLIATYFLPWCVALPVTFYINGLFLKRFSPKALFMAGNILQGLTVFLLMFSPRVNYPIAILFGGLLGIGAGFFWANRTLLTIKTTDTTNRIYFSSLEAASGILLSILVPIIIGWVLVFGDKVNLYSINFAYRAIALAAIVISFISGYCLKNSNVKTDPISKVSLSRVTKTWNDMRVFTYLVGLYHGVELFLPTLFILIFVGNEDKLGLVQSLASVLSVIAAYFTGRKLSQKHRVALFAVGVILIFLGTLSFSLLYSGLGALLLIATTSIGYPLYGVSYASLSNDSIDREEAQTGHNHYSFIYDEEVYLNLGRITSILALIAAYKFISSDFSLRVIPVAVLVSQFAMIWIAKSIDSHNLKHKHITEAEAEAELTHAITKH